MSKRSMLQRVMVLALIAIAPVGLNAADKDSPAPDTSTIETHVYDVRDLLVVIPKFDYPAPHVEAREREVRLVAGWVVEDYSDEPTRNEQIEVLTTLIQDTVGKQEEWAAYGGDVSSLRELSGQLIIKTTFANHRVVERLLKQLRAPRATQIAVDAYYVLVPTKDLDAFKKEHANGTPVLDEKAADIFVKLATERKQEMRIVGTARLLGFSWQSFITVGNRPETIAPRLPGPDANVPSTSPGGEPEKPSAKDENGNVTAGVVTRRIVDGVFLAVEPTLSHDRKRVQVNVQSSITTGTKPDGLSGGETGSFRTSVTIPNRGGVLLGCTSHRTDDDDADTDRELILLLRARSVSIDDAKHVEQE